jgi:DNA modification methylase
MEALGQHPTVKPIALIADALKDCTSRGDLVLDPFGGSGSTLLAAERGGRRLISSNVDIATSMSASADGRT